MHLEVINVPKAYRLIVSDNKAHAAYGSLKYVRDYIREALRKTPNLAYDVYREDYVGCPTCGTRLATYARCDEAFLRKHKFPNTEKVI